eukprot:CAMPEP_0118939868 /NCGR_PEP_ID=MMETSP1169-20130426/30073_1 /TAXON_ID=36882 /ORGANISM="Pyramimonas obovata, Strain CCMP722" /LENGTH=88 /DNA_ID=CAMNT_0006884231 /DNA_START=5 /DNA_END=268 /DNA_ORIENTATION=+
MAARSLLPPAPPGGLGWVAGAAAATAATGMGLPVICMPGGRGVAIAAAPTGAPTTAAATGGGGACPPGTGGYPGWRPYPVATGAATGG